MNYYKQGDAANAEQIKAAFEAKGYHTGSWDYGDELFFFFSMNNGHIRAQRLPASNKDYEACLIDIIKTHPDYQELELPVEPKFKVGDWIAYNENKSSITPMQIIKITENKYIVSGHWSYDFRTLEADWHLWSIEDAKDGDVLATDNGWTCIFKAFDGCTFSSYCFMDSQKWFCEVGSETHTTDSSINGNIHLATKEQRTLFFKKMQEVGYQWYAGKKELRKIIEPKFKVGDRIKWIDHDVQEQTIIDIKKDSYITVDKYGIRCALKFAKQDEWELVPKPHYDISNFHAGMPVLVREYDTCVWQWVLYSHFNGIGLFFAAGKTWRQCIPFNKYTKYLLGTTDMPSEEYINW